MEKIPVILVILDSRQIDIALLSLNFNRVQLFGIVMETGDESTKFIKLHETSISIFSFSSIGHLLEQGENFFWLIRGSLSNINDVYKTKKFLILNKVPEDNIVNFNAFITDEWVANVRYIEKNPVDYFATGISYIEAGLNFKAIWKGNGYGGINLAGSNQDLRQGYLTAKYVFEHVKPNTIKMVFIGLAPYSLRYDNRKAFTVCPRNLQYIWTLQNSTADDTHGQLLQLLISDNIKNYCLSITEKKADRNFDKLKNNVSKEFPVKALVTWQDELKNLTKKFFPETVQQNLQILEDYIKLCLENGAKPIGFMFPFAPMMHDNYDKQLLTSFRLAVNQLTKTYDFKFIDLFDLYLDYSHFYNMAHLNKKGSIAASSVLNLCLHTENIFPLENICSMDYEFFYNLSHILPKEKYNVLMEAVFKIAVEKLRRKNKIKVCFVLYDSSMWCGDELYNLFAQNRHYETTVFLCLRNDRLNVDSVVKDFRHGVEQFKAKGLNVVGVEKANTEIPTQDVIIFLTPYLEVLPEAFHLNKMTAETLTFYIPYSFTVSNWDIMSLPLMQIIYKNFLDSKFILKKITEDTNAKFSGMLYSGYPKLDVFFNEKIKFNYEWKMTHKKAKKIIWAPHWSIDKGVLYSTFHQNYKFMYEYAKSHKEISWVVKPHPNLLFSAVDCGLFKSTEELKKYFQQWNDLPNAKVETGAYYQSIFATSDGMILDSGSFIAEYQYTHKPMIFLTRDTQTFNEFGQAILKNSYRVSGDDLIGISQLIEEIFLEGKDRLFETRTKFFEENLNYKKENGMLAGEFIFKTISEEIE